MLRRGPAGQRPREAAFAKLASVQPEGAEAGGWGEWGVPGSVLPSLSQAGGAKESVRLGPRDLKLWGSRASPSPSVNLSCLRLTVNQGLRKSPRAARVSRTMGAARQGAYGETEAQRGKDACPGSHLASVAEPSLARGKLSVLTLLCPRGDLATGEPDRRGGLSVLGLRLLSAGRPDGLSLTTGGLCVL